jgi:hypothetical protein
MAAPHHDYSRSVQICLRLPARDRDPSIRFLFSGPESQQRRFTSLMFPVALEALWGICCDSPHEFGAVKPSPVRRL